MTCLQKSFSENFKNEECKIFLDEPLKNHCSFRIGGPAEVLVIPLSEKVLIKVLTYIKERELPFHILGNGSNVLISDKGLRGVTVKLMGGLSDLVYLGDGIIASGAGVSLINLCNFALKHSLTGLEFAYGIPGSVGGAVYMNAGAYGGEIKNVLYSVRSINSDGTDVTETPADKLSFSYRNTDYMKNGRIITGAVFSLKKGNSDEIKAKMDELMAKRKASQPYTDASAGSTFKRPPVGYAAAHIDECGLKGRAVGDACVSTKHAGFVINKENASCCDVLELMEIIKNTVMNEHGVLLEPEVEILKD
ncbi:MAG: UDP-N-acetylmuramate dehydrogenase [Clostridia bacterium]|nr:UDP-N-acetylmuramate dehydrogenase [Clostridia bacterium]